MEWLESDITLQQYPQNSTWQLKSLWTQRGNLDVKDDILYHQWEDILGGGKNKRLQLVLPAAQVPEVLGSLHDPCIAGHLGTKKTLEKVRFRFYWPGQKKEVDKRCADCLMCNSSKSPVKNRAQLQLSLAERPLQRIAMDIIGPLPVTTRELYIRTSVLPGIEEAVAASLCKSKGIFKGQSHKFHKPWQGPYRVVKIIGPTVYKIADCTNPRKKKVVHFNPLKWAPIGKVPELARGEDMARIDILPVGPVPGNRNGNDLVEDSLEEETVGMPSTEVTDQAPKGPTAQVPGPPEEIPPAPVAQVPGQPAPAAVQLSTRQTRPLVSLADRLSNVADVQVAPDDGLAKFICGICNRKFLLAESLITTAKASYEKSNGSPSGTGGTMGSQAQARISPPAPLPEFSPPSLMSVTVDCFLPSREDMKVVQSDMEVLVARILCDYIKDLRQLKKFVVTHIPHTYSDKMAEKSEVVVLDVLHKNETKSSDMGAKRHVMCYNTREGRLEQLEPCVEDWHCVMNFLILIWQKLVKISPRDHGSLKQLNSTATATTAAFTLSSVDQRLGRPSGKQVEKLLGLSYVELVVQWFVSVSSRT
eukprot:Em0014g696a